MLSKTTQIISQIDFLSSLINQYDRNIVFIHVDKAGELERSGFSARAQTKTRPKSRVLLLVPDMGSMQVKHPNLRLVTKY